MGWIKSRLQMFFDESSIHGLKYITEKNRNWTERLFWIVACIIATKFLVNYSLRTVVQVSQNPISFVQETSYLRWNTDFPSVSVCETDADLGGIETTAEKLFGADRNVDIDSYVREIAFFDGECPACDEICKNEVECPGNFTAISALARVSCEELITDCQWNERIFDCCSNFLPLRTEIGPCFTINSIQTIEKPKLNMIVNSSTGPGTLSFLASREIFVFLHSKEDLPFVNTPAEFKEMVVLASEFTLTFQVTEIDNDLSVREADVSGRKCRFPLEASDLREHDSYSYAACVTECRLLAQNRLCNCTHHFMRASDVPVCTLDQIGCLTENSDILKKLKPPYSSADGLVCNCESSCTEPDLAVVSKQTSAYDDDFHSKVFIQMQNLPSTRFKRYVSKTNIDLFVTIGGLLGLYLGASLLSIVEIIYFLFVRKDSRAQESVIPFLK
ncbi:Amiloride-sensitive sodium channel [Nesidiocoris tenuis]|uniref:Amiloride-sensitive sodium channel n=1 Tax=Nesidiocoris tenuis TaxID=355587 RepID=A0ABN7BAF7_9HEMI|nr:Amiloride-sensitive sodium channel [Nesidiocoris tenuis]